MNDDTILRRFKNYSWRELAKRLNIISALRIILGDLSKSMKSGLRNSPGSSGPT